MPSLQLHCGFSQEAKHVVPPKPGPRAPGNLMELNMLFIMMPSFCPRTLALAPNGVPGTGRNGGAQSGGTGLLVMMPSFCLRTVTLAPSRAPGTGRNGGGSRGHRAFSGEMWGVGVTGGLGKPRYTRCIGCCSPFQDSNLEATHDQSLCIDKHLPIHVLGQALRALRWPAQSTFQTLTLGQADPEL